MDVISMHQSGIDNVVASSGTSLTEGQIRLIHRFTENVTVIYDSDPAGIKASLRGIDLLLAEGMKIKVLLLPDGDDPDSFAQNHPASEVERYIAENEQDFISFKTRILLHGTENDPIARSRVITDIVQSIAVIPDDIMRTVYVNDCSHALNIDERVLSLQVAKLRTARLDAEALKAAKEQARATLQGIDEKKATDAAPAQATGTTPAEPDDNRHKAYLDRYEKSVLRYVLRYGMMSLGDTWDDNGDNQPLMVIDFVKEELDSDGLSFANELYGHTFDLALALRRENWADDLSRFTEKLTGDRQRWWNEGIALIRAEAIDGGEIAAREQALLADCDNRYAQELSHYTGSYIERRLASSPEDAVRHLTTDLVSEKYHLSKVHTKFSKVETEIDRLDTLVARAIYELKDAILECQTRDLREEIKQACASGKATPA
jgi:DNA primase